MDRKKSQEFFIKRNLGVSGVFMNTVEEIVLFVIMRGKNDKVNDALENLESALVSRWVAGINSCFTHRIKLGRVLLNSFSIENLAVMLADLEVLLVMLGQDDLLLVVAQL